jgi:transcriptional regulator with XRE-family HTH domain
MDVTTTKRGGRKRSRVPATERGRDLLRLMDERGWSIKGLAKLSGLARGTIELVIHSDDPSRQSAATIDALLRVGVPPGLLGRAG